MEMGRKQRAVKFKILRSEAEPAQLKGRRGTPSNSFISHTYKQNARNFFVFHTYKKGKM